MPSDAATREMLRQLGADDWTTDGLGTLICPHGHRVEPDGGCQEGCTSPLRRAALI